MELVATGGWDESLGGAVFELATGRRLYRLARLAAKPSPEARQRIDELLKRMREWPPERLRILRALEVLEAINSAESRRIIDSLAQGAPGDWLTEEARWTQARLRAKTPG
jgi:hypothetical protein